MDFHQLPTGSGMFHAGLQVKCSSQGCKQKALYNHARKEGWTTTLSGATHSRINEAEFRCPRHPA